uniref:Uncharacterized protein n=1 Tax=Panagrellus redivivus TaxID=6233 RepID=A0A7E4ZT18_PANRE
MPLIKFKHLLKLDPSPKTIRHLSLLAASIGTSFPHTDEKTAPTEVHHPFDKWGQQTNYWQVATTPSFLKLKLINLRREALRRPST